MYPKTLGVKVGSAAVAVPRTLNAAPAAAGRYVGTTMSSTATKVTALAAATLPWNSEVTTQGAPWNAKEQNLETQRNIVQQVAAQFAAPWLAVRLDLIGSKEVPEGSNHGPAPDFFSTVCGRRDAGLPWCGYTVSASTILAGVPGWTAQPGGGILGSVKGLYRAASDARAIDPIPAVGDMFFMIRGMKDQQGVDIGHDHVGWVIGITERGIVTLEGNSSNTYRVGRRDWEFAGFANPRTFRPVVR